MVKDQFPAAVSEATSVILPQWLTSIHTYLSSDITQDLTESTWDNLSIRHEAFKALDTVLSSFPKTLQPNAAEWLHLPAQSLLSLPGAFHEHIVAEGADGGPQLSEDSVTDVTADLTKLIGQIVDFTQHLVRKTFTKPLFIDSSSGQPTSRCVTLIKASIIFTQVTAEDEENWQDPNTFVTDQDNDGIAFSLRLGCLDLLQVRTIFTSETYSHSHFSQTFWESYGKVIVAPLQEAAYQVFESADAARSNAKAEWYGSTVS